MFCLGTNGEFFALSAEEKRRVIDITVEHAAGRVPVLAGTGCVTTQETIELTRYAQKAGVDAASVVTPYFAGLDQPGIIKHFTLLATACELPLILYNIPARTGVNIAWKTLEELSRIDTIVGVKDSSGNFDNTLRYIEETPEDFIVLSGNDSLILWTLMAGGQGGISGIANIFPETMVEIYRLFKAGELAEAKRVQDSIRVIRDTLPLANPNSVVKLAANLSGQDVGPARAPFGIYNEEIAEKIKAALKHYQR